jgi:hypothetical protein
MTSQDAIDAYIESLARRLHGSAIQTHRALLETEDHLRESTTDLVAGGIDAHAAQKEALARFGNVADVARGYNRGTYPYSPFATFRALLATAVQLVAASFVVIGVSAGVAYVASMLTSRQAIFGLPSNAVLPVGSCAHWLAVQPTASGCQQAGTLEASYDMIMMLGALGIIGVILLGLVSGLRRFGVFSTKAVPPTLAPAIATSMFLVAGVVLFVLGQSDAVIEQAWGRGMWYSESACALAAAIASGIVLARVIRRPFHVGQS